MAKQQTSKSLELIPPNQIAPNPENPRLFFRQEEMESLLVSISHHGIQVPIIVYKDGDGYRLLDGERRWRCAKKLNLPVIPAHVQEKPSDLQNLLMMYNIHALREQWDYFTKASKLQRIMRLFRKEHGHEPNEIELSEATGLTRGQIRRCQLLLDLPERFKKMLLVELELPKARQKLSEDLFIEMERSLKTVGKRLPEFKERIDSIRGVLVEKFREDVIGSVTDFRQLSKIATAIDRFGIKKQKAEKALNRIFDPDDKVGIRDIYETTVEFQYDERKASQQIASLTEYFDELLEEDKQDDLDDEFLRQLRELYKRLKALLRG
jgi:ParB/RepB/Spo0J family partition protein